jgi:hypothetical protein
MKKSALLKKLVLFFGIVFLLAACSPYSQQVVPFRMPAAYPNMVRVAGLEIGARAYPEPNEAQAVFGFDIRGAGLFPVQVVIDNKGAYPLEINPAQTFLVDQQNNFWPVLDKRLAYDRVAKSAQPAAIGSSAASSGFLAGAAGALIGAAIGIATGSNVGNYALSGAAIGAAAGATVGGAQAIGDHPVYREISDDLRTKSLENRPVKPMELVNGFIFFPGEASSAKEIRLQFREIGSDRYLPVALPLY